MLFTFAQTLTLWTLLSERFLVVRMSDNTMGDTAVRLTDFENIFKTFAWDNYENTFSGFFSRFRRLKFEDAILEVKWQRVKIKARKPTYTESTEGVRPDQKLVIEAEYENKTSSDQTHSFQMKRETTSTATFSVKKGMSKGVGVKLDVPLPDEMLGEQRNQTHERQDPQSSNDDGRDPTRDKIRKLATVSFGNSLSLDVEEGNSISKTLAWTVDTTITSAKDCLTVATLEIHETQAVYDLCMSVDIRGTIVVTISNTQKKLVKTVEADVATLLSDLRSTNPSRVPRHISIDLPNKTVSVPIEGKVTFRYGVKQRVKVSDGTLNIDVQIAEPSESSLHPTLLHSESSSDDEFSDLF